MAACGVGWMGPWIRIIGSTDTCVHINAASVPAPIRAVEAFEVIRKHANSAGDGMLVRHDSACAHQAGGPVWCTGLVGWRQEEYNRSEETV